MTINASFHGPKRAMHYRLLAKNDTLSFEGDGNEYISIFVSSHVAEHTAAAFNRAMQAVPDRDAIDEGWTYTTKSGVWNITCPMPRVYLAQHEEITGDGDPDWMFAEASSLIGCMDEIDDIEADNVCCECNRLLGEDNLSEVADGTLWCDDCLFAEVEHQDGLREMAEDDKAHAAMEKAAGL